MAAVTIPGLKRQTPYIGPHGNVCVATRKYVVDLAQNDTLDILILPKGARILDSIVLTSALGASVVMAVGIAAVGAGAKGAAAILNTGVDVSAASLTRRLVTGKFTDSDLTLDDDDYYLRLTLTAANPASGSYEVIVYYDFPGLK